jgi:hypothetical protein
LYADGNVAALAKSGGGAADLRPALDGQTIGGDRNLAAGAGLRPGRRSGNLGLSDTLAAENQSTRRRHID